MPLPALPDDYWSHYWIHDQENGGCGAQNYGFAVGNHVGQLPGVCVCRKKRPRGSVCACEDGLFCKRDKRFPAPPIIP